jgi:acyl dehydratase
MSMSQHFHKVFAVGISCSWPFRLTREQVVAFAELSGDKNPIHFDPKAAARCPIGKLSVPGMLGAFVFSRLLGTVFPGDGTIYRFQNLKFVKPLFVETDYVAMLKITRVMPGTHTALLSTDILEKISMETVILGRAKITNIERL